MEATIRVNNIHYNTKQRLLASGILSKTMSEDVAYLRLRCYYQQVALSVFLPENITAFQMQDCRGLAKVFDNQQIIITSQAICELTGASLNDVRKLLKGFGAKKLIIPHSSLFYGLKGEFYAMSDAVKVFLKLSNGNYTLSESNRNQKRCLVGLTLKHPNGEDGEKSARKLLTDEFIKLLNPPASAKELTYDNLDYSKLDWRKVCNQPAFKHLRKLYDCPNNEYLGEYLSADNDKRTDKLLSELAEKASKHHRKPSDTQESLAPVKTPPKPSKPQQEFETPWQMMHDPRYAKDIFDFIDVHNTWNSPDFQLETIEEFVKHLREFAVDMMQYGCPGGNVFMDVRAAYKMYGSPQEFKFGGFDWTIKEFFNDFNVSFDKQLVVTRRDNLQGAAILAVASTEIVKYFELMQKYIKDPSIKPQ